VATFALQEVQRPLKLGELIAATLRIYGSRGWAFVPLGVIQAGAFVAADSLSLFPALAIGAGAFTLAFALVVCLVAGDRFETAVRRTAAAIPVLLVLGFIVAVPFVIASGQLLLLIFSALWLGLASFAIPAAMIDTVPRSAADRVVYALRSTTTLARAEYFHGVGVVAALLIIYVLLSGPLAVLLEGAADLDSTWARAVAQVPLAPFFFIGLSVLYFEQRARARDGGQPVRR
jgi:hypothetical protein